MKIKFDNVKFQYEEGKREVLKGISLTIDKGEWVSIIGHNGSGKSTLVKLLIGLIEPTEGLIYLDDLEVMEKNLYEIRKHIGIVFQNPDNQFVSTSVEDDIAFGLENISIPRDEMIRRVNDALEAVDMDDFRSQMPSNLSGGQKQRVAIAGILAIDPDIYILDEATSMLDPKGRDDFIRIVKTLKEKNKTIIMITHDMNEALLSDRCIVLKDGLVIKDDKTLEVLNDYDLLKSSRLEMPSALYLYHELKSRNFKNKEVLDLLWESASKM